MSVDHSLAIDVALLLPERTAARAVALNRTLSGDRQGSLRLDENHLPHITLAQQFVARPTLPALLAALAGIARAQRPLELRVRDVTTQGVSLTLAVAPSAHLQRLHEALMAALAEFEETTGGESSFLPGDEEIRPGDVDWVTHYRRRSSFGCYQPHITIGHGDLEGPVEPLDFVADRLAVCHLGRYCTCRAVLAEWRLGH
jgi:2'-5' RNA ligase superfamily